MAFQFRMEKVLALKEREKDLSELLYSESIAQFETVARKLYETLKKKEQYEQFCADKLSEGVHVGFLRQYQNHIQTLNFLILKQQSQMHQAKCQMEKHQKAAMEKSVEVKMYQTLKEKHFNDYKEKLKRAELQQLDELSLRNLGERHGS